MTQYVSKFSTPTRAMFAMGLLMVVLGTLANAFSLIMTVDAVNVFGVLSLPFGLLMLLISTSRANKEAGDT